MKSEMLSGRNLSWVAAAVFAVNCWIVIEILRKI